jgi:hypothetical protein
VLVTSVQRFFRPSNDGLTRSVFRAERGVKIAAVNQLQQLCADVCLAHQAGQVQPSWESGDVGSVLVVWANVGSVLKAGIRVSAPLSLTVGNHFAKPEAMAGTILEEFLCRRLLRNPFQGFKLWG